MGSAQRAHAQACTVYCRVLHASWRHPILSPPLPSLIPPLCSLLLVPRLSPLAVEREGHTRLPRIPDETRRGQAIPSLLAQTGERCAEASRRGTAAHYFPNPRTITTALLSTTTADRMMGRER